MDNEENIIQSEAGGLAAGGEDWPPEEKKNEGGAPGEPKEAAGEAASPGGAGARAARDFRAELGELAASYPEALGSGGLPDEVRRAVLNGKNATLAWTEYRLRQLEAENRSLRQDAKNAAAAPVRGSGGGAAAGGDDFIRGFDSEY